MTRHRALPANFSTPPSGGFNCCFKDDSGLKLPVPTVPAHHITQHHITVAELFRHASDRLQLSWIAGHGGGDKQLTSDTVQKPTLALIGHLRFVHPNRVQVLGCAEMDYLRNLQPDKLIHAVDNLFSTEIAAVVVANGESGPAAMIAKPERTATPQ